MDAGVYKIYFDKEEFTEYKKEQNEYTVNVDAKTLYYPFIDVITNDSSSKTEVTYPKTFPGKVTIDVTSSGGETNTIGINFVREKEQITDYIINYDGGVSGTVTKITDLSSNEYYGFSGDSLYYLEDIPEELLGSYTLSYPRAGYDNATSEAGYHSFKINRSATVYLFTKADAISGLDSSFEKVTFKDNPLFGWCYPKASSEANLHQAFRALYKKHIDVSEFSEEDVTVNLPGVKSWYTIMVKFD